MASSRPGTWRPKSSTNWLGNRGQVQSFQEHVLLVYHTRITCTTPYQNPTEMVETTPIAIDHRSHANLQAFARVQNSLRHDTASHGTPHFKPSLTQGRRQTVPFACAINEQMPLKKRHSRRPRFGGPHTRGGRRTRNTDGQSRSW